ncbi:MAG TPA: sulfatase [Candidatus Hydrogenedentes bacterium]|nr:sulfatase [Candidatus Hydrogenedentota bacterium]HPG69321.1 sulfatase [Candidatus Hydrogenedentota bacterium]
MTCRTSRRDFMKSAGVAALAAAAPGRTARAESARAARKRNILFILIDDLRYDGLSILNPYFRTPHLDALAQDGILFDRAFVTTSLCSPSRASILTGQYAHVHGVLDNSTLLPADTPTFPQELQRAGYRTGFAGKWHMGGSTDAPQPGFDRWVSFRGQGVYYNPTFNIDGEQEKREGYVTDLITDYADEFIRASKDGPFMLYMSHKAVHGDFYPAERHKDSYAGKKFTRPASMADSEENYRGKPAWVRAQRQSWHGVDGMYNKHTDFDTFTEDYAETLLAVDDSVGRIVDTLKELGLLDSTLIFFTSDNGFQFGEHGLIDKRTMYETSIRVPLIAHCPELFKGGQRRKEMILNIDFAPTMLEAGGVAIPDSVQGESFYGLLTGERTEWRDAWLYEYFWERSFPQTPSVLGVRTDRYKLMQYHGVWDRYELYDLDNDPDEMDNLLADFMIENEGGTLDGLIARTAEGEIKGLFNDLRGRLDAMLKQYRCAAEPNWHPWT